VQAIFDHQRGDRRDFVHLMAQRLWILALQQDAAREAGPRVVLDHLIHPLERQQFRPGSGMTLLPTPLEATALAAL
jgi:hypothetical protein